MTDIQSCKVSGINLSRQEDIAWRQLVISPMKQYKRAGREIKKRRFKKYRFISGPVSMLAIPPFGASSRIALWRANNKRPVELVVYDLGNYYGIANV